MPGVVAAKVHDPLEVPPEDSVTLGEHEAESPEGDDTARLTGPDRPKRLAMLTVLVPEDPAVNETDPAVMLKSITVTGRAIESLSEPLVPVMVTVACPTP